MSSTPPAPRRRRIAGERTRVAVDPPSTTETLVRPRPADEPESDQQSIITESQRPPRWLVPIIALTIVATVLAGWMGWQTLNDEAEADTSATVEVLPGSDAVPDAKAAAAVLLSYNYARLDSQLEQMTTYLTDGYAERFLATFPENVRERLVQREVVVETTVRAAAPTECGTACEPDEAQVLLFIDKLTTTAGGEQELVPNRVVLSMQREGDTWLVDDIASY